MHESTQSMCIAAVAAAVAAEIRAAIYKELATPVFKCTCNRPLLEWDDGMRKHGGEEPDLGSWAT